METEGGEGWRFCSDGQSGSASQWRKSERRDLSEWEEEGSHVVEWSEGGGEGKQVKSERCAGARERHPHTRVRTST